MVPHDLVSSLKYLQDSQIASLLFRSCPVVNSIDELVSGSFDGFVKGRGVDAGFFSQLFHGVALQVQLNEVAIKPIQPRNPYLERLALDGFDHVVFGRQGYVGEFDVVVYPIDLLKLASGALVPTCPEKVSFRIFRKSFVDAAEVDVVHEVVWQFAPPRAYRHEIVVTAFYPAIPSHAAFACISLS